MVDCLIDGHPAVRVARWFFGLSNSVKGQMADMAFNTCRQYIQLLKEQIDTGHHREKAAVEKQQLEIKDLGSA
jgi:hypothetical protein